MSLFVNDYQGRKKGASQTVPGFSQEVVPASDLETSIQSISTRKYKSQADLCCCQCFGSGSEFDLSFKMLSKGTPGFRDRIEQRPPRIWSVKIWNPQVHN